MTEKMRCQIAIACHHFGMNPDEFMRASIGAALEEIAARNPELKIAMDNAEEVCAGVRARSAAMN